MLPQSVSAPQLPLLMLESPRRVPWGPPGKAWPPNGGQKAAGGGPGPTWKWLTSMLIVFVVVSQPGALGVQIKDPTLASMASAREFVAPDVSPPGAPGAVQNRCFYKQCAIALAEVTATAETRLLKC